MKDGDYLVVKKVLGESTFCALFIVAWVECVEILAVQVILRYAKGISGITVSNKTFLTQKQFFRAHYCLKSQL